MLSADLYSGSSESFRDLTEGYLDYGRQVIAGRAIPDVRDGLKPVTRRIIYACECSDKGHLQKCSTLVGAILNYHPHGDQAVYGALTLLTDENGSCNMPFLHGMGNLGKVFSNAKPAQMRYPKAMLNANAKDFFKEKAVMDMIPAEEGEGFEPSVLPAIYPVVLVNGAEGIAVSAGTAMAPFNFGDVIDLTVKHISTGGDLKIEDAIAPDFPTGGILVKNDAELAKIMLTGKGKLKVRANVEIVGKDILVKEVPYGKTVEGIVKAIRTLKENKGTIGDSIDKVRESVDRNSDSLVVITCKSKRVVEEVLLSLYRQNILQNVFSSNMLVIEDGEPKIIGVYEIINCWYKWRLTVLEKKFNKLIDDLGEEMITLDYFLRLINNAEWRDTYINKAVREKKAVADAYLKEIFPDIPQSVCNWIIERSVSAFNNGGTYIKRYSALQESEKAYKYNLGHLDEYIINELTALKKSKRGMYERKTQTTYQDYRFSKISGSDEIEDTSFCVYTMYENGFLTKTRGKNLNRDGVLCEIEAQANSVLIGFDNYGRIVRVLGKEIPFTGDDDNGVYLPKYCEGDFDDNYRVLYLSLLDGKRKMLVYRDGYIGFFDTSEYVDKKNIKIISKGVCLAVYDKLLHVYDEKDIPELLLLADEVDDKIKLGIVETQNILLKSRTSRTKVLSGSGDIDTKYLKGFHNWFEAVKFLEGAENFNGKYKVFKGDFYGDTDEIVDGRYLGICRDYE